MVISQPFGAHGVGGQDGRPAEPGPYKIFLKRPHVAAARMKVNPHARRVRVPAVLNEPLGFTRKVSYPENLNDWKGIGKEDE